MRHTLGILFCLILMGCSKKVAQQEVQEVKPAYLPSQDISITTAPEVQISGTLEFVNFDRLVIFIAGSGPTDRNCNAPMLGLKTNAFKKLAAFLKSNGISSYRYDKRTVGKSSMVPEELSSVITFTNDASKVANYFSKDFKEIIVLGHSEGALVGSTAAHQNPNIKKFISVSGTSITIDELLLKQYAPYPDLIPEVEKHFEEIKNNEPLSDVSPGLQLTFRESVVPYYKAAMETDPLVEIQKVKIPVLIIGGECDLQVPTLHAVALNKNCSDCKLVTIKNMGHTVKRLEEDCANALQAYSKPELPLHPEFTSAVLNFISSN